ncbi:MAG: type II toxin-antitoxin system VapC family toxin [Gaiellaceae bacterium]
MIFVDTSFWVGLTVPTDDRHLAARTLIVDHADARLMTSSHVRGETWTLLRRRVGHRVAVAFLEGLERPGRLELAFVTERLEREALDWLRRHDERPYSFVDATSFALMRSLGIREALAFDGDFAAAGFVELTPA